MFSFFLLAFIASSAPLPDAQELGRGTPNSKFFYHYPPDPVNVRTLNFFFPIDEHLALPCFMPIEIKIAYNSYSGESSIFGEKWTFNHNIRVNKAGTKLEVVEGDGFINPYNRERNLELTKSSQIEQILIAQKKVDAQAGGLKSAQTYDELKRRLDRDEAYREEMASKYLSTNRPLSPGTYYSFARGPSTLELRADGSYVRQFQNGSEEFFDKDGKIVRSQDRNGNYLTYAYTSGNLSRINDMCGRYVSFFYQPNPAMKGLVQRISDSIGREIRYDFLPSRRLKSYVDSVGKKLEFDYDKMGNMTSLISTRPGKPVDTIKLEYNSKFETKTQSGPGPRETQYKRTFVANNPNHSITEITKTENQKLVGRELHEFKAKEFETVTKFDGSGKEVSREIKTFSPETGYPISILDGRGSGDKFQYDGKTGNLMRRESVPSGDIMTFDYEQKCNQVKLMKIVRPAQPPVTMNFKFDDKCNLREAEELSGDKRQTWITLEYLKNGKLSFLRDRIGQKEIAFTYWPYGKPDSITLKNVGTLKVQYSPTGEIQKVDTFPHGTGADRYKGKKKEDYQPTILAEVRSTLDNMMNYLRPAGLNIGL